MGAVPGALPDPLGPRVRLSLILAIIAFHAALAWGLLQLDPVREAVGAFAPIVIDLIAPPAATTPTPPPRPQPVHETPVSRPTIAVDTPALQPAYVVPPAPEPLPAEPRPAVPQGSAAPNAPGPALQPRTIAISQVEYLTPPLLEYPLASRRLAEEGKVEVRVLVDARGLPGEARVLRSSGSPRLDAAALATVRATRFKPYTEDGNARPFWVVMPLLFELSE
ncbi:MAG: energy transducer TonB [Gammaproteobacteria bacterium]|nr:energy transducer TonB [Gammaproteobacteria bacterium]